jgi:hypothetical protein
MPHETWSNAMTIKAPRTTFTSPLNSGIENLPGLCGTGSDMLGIPRRYSHFVFGVIQSGLTCAIAAAIASYPFFAEGTFVAHWLGAWAVAWLMMIPVVLFAAPAIRHVTHALTRED